MRPRSLKLTPNLDEMVERLARARNTSYSAVVREAVAAYVVGPTHSAASIAGDRVGALHGPRDLSTSPKHLDGFGE